MSTIENLRRFNSLNFSTSKTFKKIFNSGKKKPKIMITPDNSISEFKNKSLLTDRIENSELKNQNSSIRAIGKVTPKTRNKVSKNTNIYFK